MRLKMVKTIGETPKIQGKYGMDERLDPINRRILAELVANARIPITELAKAVGLSKTPVALRIKQMEEMGLITGYRAILSPLKLGLTHVTYVEVQMNDTRKKALAQFNDAVRLIPEVEECYMIAGGFDYLLKVRSRDMAHYRQIMGEKISDLPHVNSTRSYVSMEAVVEQNWVSL